MGKFINQNSFLLLVVIVWVIAAGVLLRRSQGPRSLAILAGVTVVLLGIFFWVRLAPGTRDPAADIKARIGAGSPVLLEFRSQY